MVAKLYWLGQNLHSGVKALLVAYSLCETASLVRGGFFAQGLGKYGKLQESGRPREGLGDCGKCVQGTEGRSLAE